MIDDSKRKYEEALEYFERYTTLGKNIRAHVAALKERIGLYVDNNATLIIERDALKQEIEGLNTHNALMVTHFDRVNAQLGEVQNLYHALRAKVEGSPKVWAGYSVEGEEQVKRILQIDTNEAWIRTRYDLPPDFIVEEIFAVPVTVLEDKEEDDK